MPQWMDDFLDGLLPDPRVVIDLDTGMPKWIKR